MNRESRGEMTRASAVRSRMPGAPMTKAHILWWSVLMTIGGVATAVIVYRFTDSLGWALTGMVAFGIVVNALVRPNRSFGRPR